MLKAPSKEVLEALAALEHDARFGVVLGWVKESKDDVVTSMASSDGNPVYRAQGAFGVLDALHNHAKNARDTLEKLSRSK